MNIYLLTFCSLVGVASIRTNGLPPNPLRDKIKEAIGFLPNDIFMDVYFGTSFPLDKVNRKQLDLIEAQECVKNKRPCKIMLQRVYSMGVSHEANTALQSVKEKLAAIGFWLKDTEVAEIRNDPSLADKIKLPRG
jgi:hypothetical protein